MSPYPGEYNSTNLQSLNRRISNYQKTIDAYQLGLAIPDREYRLATVKMDCLLAQKQYLEYLYLKNKS